MADETKEKKAKVDRRKARKRRENVARRAVARGAEGAPPSAFLITRPIVIGPEDSKVVVPVLIPDRERKYFEGRYPTREIVEKLRNALAVYAFETHYSLLAIFRDTGDGFRSPEREAKDRVEKCTGTTWSWLRRVALEHLSELTLFRDTADVKRWAKRKIEAMKAGGQITRNRTNDNAIKAELAALEILSFAYHRAIRIVTECEEVERLRLEAKRKGIDVAVDEAIQADIHARVQNAFNSPGWDRPVSDLIQIAIFGDINPATLWPQRADLFATLFEVARFVGRVNAGRAATLHVDCHGLVRKLFRGNLVYDFKIGQVAAGDIRHHLTDWFTREQLVTMIARADASKQSVGVTAVERQLVLLERAGPPPTLPERALAFLTLFSRKCEEFFRINPAHRR